MSSTRLRVPFVSTRRERVMVNLLLWVAALSVTGLLAYGQVARRGEVRQRLGLLEQQARRYGGRLVDEEALLRQREEAFRALAEERGRFYGPGEIDPYRFGGLIRDLLVREGLEIGRYQTVDIAGRTHLEFAVAGDALALARFLKEVSASGRYWSVPFLSVDGRAGSGRIRSVFRIGYETVEDVDR
jgi:hypothetical protein